MYVVTYGFRNQVAKFNNIQDADEFVFKMYPNSKTDKLAAPGVVRYMSPAGGVLAKIKLPSMKSGKGWI